MRPDRLAGAAALAAILAGMSHEAAAVPLVVSGTAGNDTFQLFATGPDSGFYSVNGQFFTFAGIDGIVFEGDDGDDMLTFVDSSSGAFAPPEGVTFNGGGNGTGGDSLSVQGGGRDSVTHTFLNENDGSIEQTSGSSTLTISYTGLEPIVDDSFTDRLVLEFQGGAETITLAGAGTGRSQIDSTAAESLDFANPFLSLTILFDPLTDTFVNQGLGNDFTAALLINPAVAAPEPATLALFGLGLAGLGLARRRRAA